MCGLVGTISISVDMICIPVGTLCIPMDISIHVGVMCTRADTFLMPAATNFLLGGRNFYLQF